MRGESEGKRGGCNNSININININIDNQDTMATTTTTVWLLTYGEGTTINLLRINNLIQQSINL